jgi:hypothetical protein
LSLTLWIDIAARPPQLAEGGFAMTRPAWPYLEQYGYTWIQHPDGLYYGPSYLGADEHLDWLEEQGLLGHSSVRRGEYRYFLRFPEADDA